MSVIPIGARVRTKESSNGYVSGEGTLLGTQAGRIYATVAAVQWDAVDTPQSNHPLWENTPRVWLVDLNAIELVPNTL